jgi:colanic acid/amylovoran biosynthesis glycosyltransferase
LTPLRNPRRPLRLLAIARLVPKKGLNRQLRIQAALAAAGIEFEARIVGDGPLRAQLQASAVELGLGDRTTFTGHLPESEVWRQLAWADVLLHTGVVAPSGDRDGLPNVIPEAMAAGTLVVSSTAAATTEAIQTGITGLLAEVDRPEQWVAALRRLTEDDELALRLQTGARRWAEENYDARRHAERLYALFEHAVR